MTLAEVKKIAMITKIIDPITTAFWVSEQINTNNNIEENILDEATTKTFENGIFLTQVCVYHISEGKIIPSLNSVATIFNDVKENVKKAKSHICRRHFDQTNWTHEQIFAERRLIKKGIDLCQYFDNWIQLPKTTTKKQSLKIQEILHKIEKQKIRTTK